MPSSANPLAGQSFRWRTARRILLGLAVLATLLAIVYTEEDWRGKRAWQDYRRGLEAKGVVMNWDSYIPPPVPDEQNIFKAPKMKEWFVTDWPGLRGSNELTEHLRAGTFTGASRAKGASANFVQIAELNIAPAAGAAAQSNQAETVWRAGTPAARERAQNLVRDAIGPITTGPQNFLFVARPLEEMKPARILIQAGEPPSAAEIRALFPVDTALPGGARLRVEASGGNSFGVWLSPPTAIAAADYLAWSPQCAADFSLLREALKRPYARMDGDYRQPFAGPTPDFLTVRSVARALASRAQCYLLLGQPDAAWRELALIRQLCRVLEAGPTGKPTTLVAAMIDLAVTGLYIQPVADGLRLRAWREPQLAAIEQQLKEADLLPCVSAAFECERLAASRTLETTGPAGLADLYLPGSREATLWRKITDPTRLLLRLAPRGWVYLDMISGDVLIRKAMDAIDLTNRLVRPRPADHNAPEALAAFGRFSPLAFLARHSVTNLSKATAILAQRQTTVNQAQLACALERFRLAHGEYPEALRALVPEFIDPLPPDLINGQPLKYRRTTEGGFLLYSVGWNEIDDGGAPGQTTAEGDWVWEKQ